MRGIRMGYTTKDQKFSDIVLLLAQRLKKFPLYLHPVVFTIVNQAQMSHEVLYKLLFNLTRSNFEEYSFEDLTSMLYEWDRSRLFNYDS